MTPRCRPNPPRRTRPGVTLLELVLVILIVAVLASLVWGLVADALGAARSVQCRNRLRQIGVAYRGYMRESGGLWPPIMTRERPEKLLRRIEEETGLAAAPERPADRWGRPGPHWSIVLYPYLGDFGYCTCPADPNAGRRGREVVPERARHAVALLDAPPESYALNVVLFRTADDFRRQAGCSWGTDDKVDFNGLHMYTSQAEQRRVFGSLGRRVLFFCGASGMTVGSPYNVPFRDGPGLAGVERWEWHPRRAAEPFVDEPGTGSNYLFHGGHVEYRDAPPDRWEWGYDLDRRGRSP